LISKLIITARAFLHDSIFAGSQGASPRQSSIIWRIPNSSDLEITGSYTV
jgi:hypothetical protein